MCSVKTNFQRMNKRLVFYCMLAALIGWICLGAACLLHAQEQGNDFKPGNQGPGNRPQRPLPGQRQDHPNGPREGVRSNGGEDQHKPESRARGPMANMRIGGRVLIAVQGLDPKAQHELNEDLNTMLHLVERTVERVFAGPQEDDFRRFVLPMNNSESQALMLDDYGVVFSFRTFVPLFGTEPAHDDPPATASDSEWEKARQELFGGNGPEGQRNFRSNIIQYDARKIGELKDALVKLLREANNLRHLKPEQQVVLAFSGPSALVTPPAVKPQVNLDERRSLLERFRNQLNQSTMLVLTVKKADIDAFAAGKLTAEQFQSKVAVVNK